MRKPLSLLVASTALSAAIGLPVWSASPSLMEPAPSGPGLIVPGLRASGGTPAQAMPRSETVAGLLVLASGDDDEGDDDEEDEDDDDDDDDCHDADDDCGGRRANPAPAGTVAPPANGLFGTGAPPQVKVN